jgi:hypothetical protein
MYSILLLQNELLKQGSKPETLSWVYLIAGEEPKKN